VIYFAGDVVNIGGPAGVSHIDRLIQINMTSESASAAIFIVISLQLISFAVDYSAAGSANVRDIFAARITSGSAIFFLSYMGFGRWIVALDMDKNVALATCAVGAIGLTFDVVQTIGLLFERTKKITGEMHKLTSVGAKAYDATRINWPLHGWAVAGAASLFLCRGDILGNMATAWVWLNTEAAALALKFVMHVLGAS
jgi:hypothetical protein